MKKATAKNVTLYLPLDVIAALRKTAKAQKMTMSGIVTDALKSFIVGDK